MYPDFFQLWRKDSQKSLDKVRAGILACAWLHKGNTDPRLKEEGPTCRGVGSFKVVELRWP